jgi:hypothetical protein
VRLWLDDPRVPPDPSWRWVKTPQDAIDLLKTGDVIEVSLDHDLGLFAGEREQTGYDVLLWLEEKVATEGFRPPARDPCPFR